MGWPHPPKGTPRRKKKQQSKQRRTFSTWSFRFQKKRSLSETRPQVGPEEGFKWATLCLSLSLVRSFRDNETPLTLAAQPQQFKGLRFSFFLLCVGRLLTFALFVCRSFVLRIFPSPRASKSSFHLYKFFSAHHFIVCPSNIYVLFPPPSGERKKEDLPQWFPLPKGGDIYNIIPTPKDIDFFAQISKLHNTHSPDRRH